MAPAGADRLRAVSIDPEKLFVVFVIALIVLGPSRLPGAARSLGKGLAELRKYTSTLRSEVDQVLAEPRALIQSAVHDAEMHVGLGGQDGAGPRAAESPFEHVGNYEYGGPSAEVDGVAGTVPPWASTPGAPPGAPDDPSFN